MKILINDFYNNNTRKFLYPCLKGHGEEFTEKLNSVYKFATGVHDMAETEMYDKNLIYVMFDRLSAPNRFKQFLNWLKYQPYFIKDYVSGPELSSRKHMVVLELPQEFDHAYSRFLEGNFFDMFTVEQKTNMFKTDNGEEALKILNKTGEALENYVKILNETFHEKLTLEICKDHENYNLPNIAKEEIFNWTSSTGPIEFNPEKNKSWLLIE